MRLFSSVVVTIPLLAGCQKNETPAGASSTPAGTTTAKPASTAAASASPSGAPGSLTPELLKKVVLELDVYKPTGEHNDASVVFAQAKSKLGEPTFVGKATQAWGVVTPESCSVLEIEDKDGKAYSDGVMSADFNDGHNQAYGPCLAKLGKAPAKTP